MHSVETQQDLLTRKLGEIVFLKDKKSFDQPTFLCSFQPVERRQPDQQLRFSHEPSHEDVLTNTQGSVRLENMKPFQKLQLNHKTTTLTFYEDPRNLGLFHTPKTLSKGAV